MLIVGKTQDTSKYIQEEGLKQSKRVAAGTVRVMRDRSGREMSQMTGTSREDFGQIQKQRSAPLGAVPKCCYLSGVITSNKRLTCRNSCTVNACIKNLPGQGRGHGSVASIACVEVALEVPWSVWHCLARWQPSWHVLVVFLRTPLCFQLICFDISSRQEVLCVGVRGSAM